MKHIIAITGTGASAPPPFPLAPFTPPIPAPRAGPDRPRLRLGLLAVLAAALVLAACGDGKEDEAAQVPEGLLLNKKKFPNPAAVNCRDKDGITYIAKRPDGGEYGICLFATGGQCEEWAMVKGFCPVGGVDVSVYPTPAARYCAIRGGTFVAAKSGDGQCRVLTGETCPAEAYYSGDCGGN